MNYTLGTEYNIAYMHRVQYIIELLIHAVICILHCIGEYRIMAE